MSSSMSPFQTKQASEHEKNARQDFRNLFDRINLSTEDKLDNLGLFINRQNWGKFLFMHELYQKIVNVHGVVMEFGVRYGQNLALFSNFRGIYEPYNHNRRIIGFDTFTGFPSVHEKDGGHHLVHEGAYSVGEDHQNTLESILNYHESESPISHMKKFELVKGDATKTLDSYLDNHPETIIALAYFDFDIYAPTRHCLERIRPHLVKGSVLGFDELNHPPFPGETMAVAEVLGLPNLRLQRLPYSPTTSFAVVE